MGAITGTSVVNTELVGKKIGYVTATVASASDTVTLTVEDHGFSSIDVAIPIVTAGFDAAFMHCEASVSGLVITVTSEENDGTAATDFTGTTIGLLIIGNA
jgi:hypothetical protein